MSDEAQGAIDAAGTSTRARAAVAPCHLCHNHVGQLVCPPCVARSCRTLRQRVAEAKSKAETLRGQLAEDVAMRARLSERAAAVTEARARLESTRSRLRVAEELVAEAKDRVQSIDMDVRRRKESLARLRDRVAQWEKHQDEARQAARDALEVACRLSQLRVEQVLPTVIGPMRRCLGAHMLVPQRVAKPRPRDRPAGAEPSPPVPSAVVLGSVLVPTKALDLVGMPPVARPGDEAAAQRACAALEALAALAEALSLARATPVLVHLEGAGPTARCVVPSTFASCMGPTPSDARLPVAWLPATTTAAEDIAHAVGVGVGVGSAAGAPGAGAAGVTAEAVAEAELLALAHGVKGLFRHMRVVAVEALPWAARERVAEESGWPPTVLLVRAAKALSRLSTASAMLGHRSMHDPAMSVWSPAGDAVGLWGRLGKRQGLMAASVLAGVAGGGRGSAGDAAVAALGEARESRPQLMRVLAALEEGGWADRPWARGQMEDMDDDEGGFVMVHSFTERHSGRGGQEDVHAAEPGPADGWQGALLRPGVAGHPWAAAAGSGARYLMRSAVSMAIRGASMLEGVIKDGHGRGEDGGEQGGRPEGAAPSGAVAGISGGIGRAVSRLTSLGIELGRELARSPSGKS